MNVTIASAGVALESEEAIVRVLLDAPELVGAELDGLSADDFRDGRAHRAFLGFLAVRSRGAVDAALVEAEVRLRLDADAASLAWLDNLKLGDPQFVALAEHVRAVRDARDQRDVAALGRQITFEAEAGTPAAVVLEEARQSVALLATRGVREDGLRSAADLAKEIASDIESPSPLHAPIPTGLRDLDAVLGGGLRDGQLVVVAGRTSMGKTTFAMNVAANVAESGTPVLVVSLEMRAGDVVRNIVASRCGVETTHVHLPRLLRGDERRVVREALGRVGAFQLHLHDRPPVTLARLRSMAARLKARSGLGLLVVDYLQLMDASGIAGRGSAREQEVAGISRGLKSIAMELDVPVVALSQLNRAVEGRDGNRPRLSDLRESGAIENDADVVALLFRPYYYSQREEDRGVAEVHVAKQRNGPTDTVTLSYVGACARFGDHSACP